MLRSGSPLIFLATLAIGLFSCQSPKTANASNFKTAIQAELDKHPDCLFVHIPQEQADNPGRSMLDQNNEALVSAGLAQKTQKTVKLPMSIHLDGTVPEVPGIRYDLTPEGQKYAQAIPQPGVALFGESNSKSICYGTREVTGIVRYSEPGSAGGRTVTEVTYTYALKSIPSWTRNEKMVGQFPALANIPTHEHPKEAKIVLVLMNDGWRVSSE